MGDTVLYDAADAEATLTLNRPERRNAITPQVVEDFGVALDRALARRCRRPSSKRRARPSPAASPCCPTTA